ncbi:MAG: ABC transporter ATP-binding protein [Verrucomicrobia bacterium]|nr:ABC transporter ATP-binding protein [Verrucomicrobiota bacterium]MDA1087730.1 ABC transporter ATP-binding protein [Verrucomicrobiota bacterium]
MTAPAISIQGLSKQYGDLTALHGIDLEVQPGEFFGLLGPNGAGKTTTINILAGLCVKTAGTVQLFGHDLVREYRRCRELVGLVPQEFNFDQFVRLRVMLVFQGGFFGIPTPECHRRVDEILRTLDLDDKKQSQMRHLSGGMKRRALIARALVHRPQLLILDEPTAGVDVDLRKALWALLRELNAAGTTILLTTHYLEEAEALCDRVAIIDHGRIIADDSTRNLLNTLTRETIIVTTTGGLSETSLAGLADYDPTVNGGGDEVRLSFDKASTDYNAVLRTLLEGGIDVTSIRPVDNRLEQVFLQLTGRQGKA